ncbi:MAG: HlyC/CorC family transporter [Chloroflexi bacterium]|nr:HlyC/CorC family transporter [Chloroflexota bacterium]
MLVEISIWILLVALAGAANAVQATAQTVRELQPAASRTRADRLDFWSGVVGAVVIALAAALVAMALLAINADARGVALGVAFSTLAVLIWRDLARDWARQNLQRLVLPLFGDAAPFLPLVEPRDESPEAEATRDETVEQMVEASEKVGLIESDEHEMITGILQLDHTQAREIMVPRMDVIALDVETCLSDALVVVIDGAHARVPVYAETIDHVAGILYAKDLLRALRDGKTDALLRELARPAYFVPESKRLDELLQEMQRHHVHMAVIVDEYGGTAGIVTIEDILEEIVGEIQDEYDAAEEPLIERISDSEGVFDARVPVDKVNEILELNLPTDNDTLGGLVYQRLEKMPKAGDQVRVDDATISVVNVIGRRIKKVRVAKMVNEPMSQ